MYFLDFFAGIGLFRLGLEQAGWTCKGHCEIDKYANMSYQAMHCIKEGEWFEEDITKVSAQSLPDVDLWTGGFPCQDVSMAGERRGLYGERTGLFFEFVRLLRERGDHKPRWLILENVKGIFSSGRGWDFAIVLCELAALGYGVEYALVNSKDYGVPQSRERVYIIGDLTGRSTGKIFPLRSPGNTAPAQIIGGPQGSRIYDTGGVSPTITSGTGGLGAKTGLYFVAQDEQSGLVTKPYSGTIDASYGKGLGCRQHRHFGKQTAKSFVESRKRKNKTKRKEDQRRRRGNVYTNGIRHSWNPFGFSYPKTDTIGNISSARGTGCIF